MSEDSIPIEDSTDVTLASDDTGDNDEFDEDTDDNDDYDEEGDYLEYLYLSVFVFVLFLHFSKSWHDVFMTIWNIFTSQKVGGARDSSHFISSA